MEKLAWIISLIGSLGAAAAAIAAWQSAKETRKAVITQIILEMVGYYGSQEMLSCMWSLRNWKEDHGINFAEKFAEKRRNDYAEIKHIDNCRRLYTHHFLKIKQLLDLGIVNKNIVEKIVSPVQVSFLLEVVEPLEQAINPNYDTSTFDTFRRMYKDKLNALQSDS